MSEAANRDGVGIWYHLLFLIQYVFVYKLVNWCRKVNLLKLYTLYSAAECFMHLKRTAVRRRIYKDKSEYHKKVEENIGVRKTVIT